MQILYDKCDYCTALFPPIFKPVLSCLLNAKQKHFIYLFNKWFQKYLHLVPTNLTWSNKSEMNQQICFKIMFQVLLWKKKNQVNE